MAEEQLQHQFCGSLLSDAPGCKAYPAQLWKNKFKCCASHNRVCSPLAVQSDPTPAQDMTLENAQQCKGKRFRVNFHVLGAGCSQR